MVGVLLSILLVLNMRNGMTIAGITGNTQTGVIGLLLILSVLIPNLASRAQGRFRATPARRPAVSGAARGNDRAKRRLRGGAPNPREYAFSNFGFDGEQGGTQNETTNVVDLGRGRSIHAGHRDNCSRGAESGSQPGRRGRGGHPGAGSST